MVGHRLKNQGKGKDSGRTEEVHCTRTCTLQVLIYKLYVCRMSINKVMDYRDEDEILNSKSHPFITCSCFDALPSQHDMVLTLCRTGCSWPPGCLLGMQDTTYLALSYLICSGEITPSPPSARHKMHPTKATILPSYHPTKQGTWHDLIIILPT